MTSSPFSSQSRYCYHQEEQHSYEYFEDKALSAAFPPEKLQPKGNTWQGYQFHWIPRERKKTDKGTGAPGSSEKCLRNKGGRICSLVLSWVLSCLPAWWSRPRDELSWVLNNPRVLRLSLSMGIFLEIASRWIKEGRAGARRFDSHSLSMIESQTIKCSRGDVIILIYKWPEGS